MSFNWNNKKLKQCVDNTVIKHLGPMHECVSQLDFDLSWLSHFILHIFPTFFPFSTLFNNTEEVCQLNVTHGVNELWISLVKWTKESNIIHSCWIYVRRIVSVKPYRFEINVPNSTQFIKWEIIMQSDKSIKSTLKAEFDLISSLVYLYDNVFVLSDQI